MPRLTKFSTVGGCGCKIPQATLNELLADFVDDWQAYDDLLYHRHDDAAVWKIDENRALLATTDFFTSPVDDPFDFGSIAAANALSDIYAMAGAPLFALSILALPLKQLGIATARSILRGAREKCLEAGAPIVGGHSIEITDPLFGLVVVGEVSPERLRHKHTGKVGDALILGKPLGAGILAAASRKDLLSKKDYADMLSVVTKLNAVGPTIAELPATRAMTDVTGFGLLGHITEMCADTGAVINASNVPLIAAAVPYAQKGVISSAGRRNLESVVATLEISSDVEPWRLDFLTDPQTNGGLLVSCAYEEREKALRVFRENGFSQASVIGRLRAEKGVLVDMG